ncbi:MAG: CHAT domain-containing protein [Pirellulaceae bacterium]
MSRPILGISRQCLLALLLGLIAGSAQAQGARMSIPNIGYFAGFDSFNDGDFKSAGEVFRRSASGGFKSIDDQRWIDSICFHTMIGECYYQMGDMENAAEQFSSAVALFNVHRDWMLRAQFSPIEPEANSKNPITWGVSQRRTKLGHFPDHFQVMQGKTMEENALAAQKGGVIVPQELYTCYIGEIVRCTALAISRRAEILGPVSQYDPITTQTVTALQRRPAPPNHWSQCWISLQLGCAYAAANKPQEAAAELTNSLQAGGTYDHPLTCLGLLELGKLVFKQGKFDAAQTYFLEATYSAALFERYDVMEEAFRYGSLTHLISGQEGVYAPLAKAGAAARKFKALHASLMISLAEQHSTRGETAAAAVALGQARGSLVGNEMMAGQTGARFNYENAKVQFQAGNVGPGNASLALAMAFQKAGSKRLFQIGFIDKVVTDGELTVRIGDLLYADILREPTTADWMVEPMETLTVLSTPHPQPYEHWLEIALGRKELDKALVIADRIRRHRFHSTLPLGGRLLALRWVLEAPKESLSPAALLQRQDFSVKYPKYSELSKKAAAIKNDLDALPLVPEKDADKKKQAALCGELAKVSTSQEIILQQMALRRDPSDLSFPPLVEFKDMQQKLQPGQLVLAYLSTSQSVHGFALSKDNYGHFRVADPAKVTADIATMLRALGLHDRNQPLDAKDLKGEEWKIPAAALLGQLTNQMNPDDWGKFKELVVVPDGVLWYLPFEALQLPGKAGGSEPLISRVKVRYAPTVALALPDGRGKKPLARTAVVAGRLMPRDDDKPAAASAAEIVKALPGSSVLERIPAPSSVLGSTIDRLVVLSDVDDVDKGSYGFAPLQMDRGKPGSTLADWFPLPFASPEQIVLPGFHSAAEYSLKRGGTGDEIFLSLCGLMSTGSRTILITRWRPAGQTTFDLVREFVQELPRATATDAWHRAVQLARSTEIDSDREPRVKLSPNDSLKAEHPFFWAGYLLVDRDSGDGDAKAEVKAIDKKEAVPAKEAVPKAAEKAKEPAEPVKEVAPVKKPAPIKPAANKGAKVKG